MLKTEPIHLICLPFAGGNINSYKGFQKHFSNQYTIITIELPGRGTRIKETLLTDINEIANDVFSQVYKYLHKPYAIYGHSMGALVGYELCKKIQNENLALPLHLFVSGKSGPSAHLNYEKLHRLPTQEFWIEIKEMGGVPQVILNEPELMNYFEPILKADLKAVEEYSYGNTAMFTFPITAFIGNEENISDENANLWQKETLHPLNFYKFKGNHFFIFNHYPQLAEVIMSKIQL